MQLLLSVSILLRVLLFIRIIRYQNSHHHYHAYLCHCQCCKDHYCIHLRALNLKISFEFEKHTNNVMEWN